MRAGMRRSKGADGAAADEAVGGGMGRNSVENLSEDAALQTLQARLGSFDQAHCAVSVSGARDRCSEPVAAALPET